MATGFFAILDDIAALLDDVASMTTKAATKTAGVTGDDLAVTAGQLSGVNPSRELPIVWEVAKGSLKNKALLIPATLGISALAMTTGLPLVASLMMVGGTYLCYEGMEKIVEKIFHKDSHKEDHKKKVAASTPEELVKLEKSKISSAVRLDAIMSAEIMIISLGTMAAAPLLTQLAVLGAIGLGMTAFVYGLVGAIAKIDDVGLRLTQKKGDAILDKAIRGLGYGILKTAPHFMKGLSILGTAAMFMVGGGILMHNIPFLEHMVHHAPALITDIVAPIAAGLVAGVAAVAGHQLVAPIIDKIKPHLPKITLPKVTLPKIALPKFSFGKKKEATVETTPAPAATPQVQAESKLAVTPDLTAVVNEAAAPPVKASSQPESTPEIQRSSQPQAKP